MFLGKKINFKRLIIFISIFILLFLLAIIFFKNLKKENIYIPNKLIGKEMPNFSSQSLLDDQYLNSEKIFTNKKYYLINIWASWCGPCRDEHPYLVKLSQNDKLEIIGINFKDKKKHALSFLSKEGNPYKEIFIDDDGSLSINIGAYGVPETFLINRKKIILLKLLGSLNSERYQKILNIINNEK